MDGHPQAGAAASADGAVPGYDLLGELGRGAMGVVYRARQTRLNRVVALKMVLSGAHASAAEVQRFLSEAEAVARMQHPNIVQIFETASTSDCRISRWSSWTAAASRRSSAARRCRPRPRRGWSRRWRGARTTRTSRASCTAT
jgi:hypothetical protein